MFLIWPLQMCETDEKVGSQEIFALLLATVWFLAELSPEAEAALLFVFRAYEPPIGWGGRSPRASQLVGLN